MTIREAFLIPNLFYIIGFIGILYQFYYRFFHGKFSIISMSILFAMFSGGLGFLIWIYSYGMNIRVNMDLDFLERWRIDEQYPLPWWGIYTHILLPHLETIYSYPIVFSIWILFLKGFNVSTPLKASLMCMGVAGIFTAILSLYQIFAYFSVILLFFGFILLSPKEMNQPAFLITFLIYIIPVVLIIPVIIYYFGQCSLVGESPFSFSFFLVSF